MDALEQLQRDFIEGRVDLPRLFSFLSKSLRHFQVTQRQLQASEARLQDTQQQLKTAQDRIEDVEKKLGGTTTS